MKTVFLLLTGIMGLSGNGFADEKTSSHSAGADGAAQDPCRNPILERGLFPEGLSSNTFGLDPDMNFMDTQSLTGYSAEQGSMALYVGPESMALYVGKDKHTSLVASYEDNQCCFVKNNQPVRILGRSGDGKSLLVQQDLVESTLPLHHYPYCKIHDTFILPTVELARPEGGIEKSDIGLMVLYNKSFGWVPKHRVSLWSVEVLYDILSPLNKRCAINYGDFVTVMGFVDEDLVSVEFHSKVTFSSEEGENEENSVSCQRGEKLLISRKDLGDLTEI